MAALECVNYVTLFGDETPLSLIELLEPDVLVKGGDWAPDKIVGAKSVIDRGGTVKSLTFQPGRSTSRIIEKIKS
jgi:D-beta-D-heptose 7-phosphate kinase/D-beta-D-heptose 1-phosphate adenosyltransferase